MDLFSFTLVFHPILFDNVHSIGRWLAMLVVLLLLYYGLVWLFLVVEVVMMIVSVCMAIFEYFLLIIPLAMGLVGFCASI